MRVSRVVREYIEEKVRKAFAEKSTAEVEYEELKRQISDFRSTLDDAVDDFIKMAIMEFRTEFNIPDDIEIKPSDYDRLRVSDWNSAIRNEANTMECKREVARANAVKDIVVTLELGGTKDDLEQMLANINTNYMN